MFLNNFDVGWFLVPWQAGLRITSNLLGAAILWTEMFCSEENDHTGMSWLDGYGNSNCYPLQLCRAEKLLRIPIKHHLHAIPNQNIADHVYPFVMTICPCYNGYIHHDNAPCQKEWVTSICFHEHDRFIVNQWPEVVVEAADKNDAKMLYGIVSEVTGARSN